MRQDFSSYYIDKIGFGYPTKDYATGANQILSGIPSVNITANIFKLIVSGQGNQLIFEVATGSPLPKAAWVHIYVDNTGKTGSLAGDFSSLTYSYGCFFESSSLPRTPCKAFTLGANYFSFQAPDGADDPDFLQSFTLTLSHLIVANSPSLEGAKSYLKLKTC